MFTVMMTLHLLAAVFVVGPLVHSVTTAGRGLRKGGAAATASSARMALIYSYASILVIIFGFGLMSATSPHTGQAVASFGETWIWLSPVLWLVAVGIALAVVVPGLKHATARIGSGETVGSLTGRVAGGGGVVGVIFVVIVILMVLQPGG